ncbi:hypothetical protein B5F13_04245 [Drancourtella sp. An177]|nr:hypothetical protein B5F13_04245 [Drancourtella sp. An177]
MNIYGSTYVRVEANPVMVMAEGGSNEGGYNVEGYYVNWDINGITGKDWEWAINEAPNSPFVGMTEQQIIDIISAPNGNLDNIFRAWGDKYDATGELTFLLEASKRYGSNQNGSIGCIGNRVY